jgi:UDP-N-acetylglucosamine diphosphorylase/glucosamine-1-phosphate N-acetyltransferase
VRIEPGVLFDTREGPIRLGDGVEVRTGTRLAGPTAIGEGSRLLGGSFERIVAGPHSYLQGEMTDCVVLGYTNKAHQGYLGHSYVGKWVNLGALTTNSDLKNNYRPVRVWTPVGVLDSGSLKIGCFLGDHVKTGIGLLLGTGTVVGAGSNLYGTAMPPRYVEPFSWGEGADLGEYRLAEFLDTAEHSMARRGVELGERGRRFLESCWRKGRGG